REIDRLEEYALIVNEMANEQKLLHEREKEIDEMKGVISKSHKKITNYTKEIKCISIKDESEAEKVLLLPNQYKQIGSKQEKFHLVKDILKKDNELSQYASNLTKKKEAYIMAQERYIKCENQWLADHAG